MTTTVPTRTVGTSDLTVSRLALGSWHTYDRIDFADAATLLRRAVDAGITLYDVGVYGMPDMPPVFTDVIFSAMVRAAGLKRDDYQVSVKLWLEGLAADPDATFRPQIENSFLRAGLDHAELAILGDFHGMEIPLDRIADAMGELTGAGLLREWGVNNWSATSIRELAAICAAKGIKGPQIAQLKYSVARRAIPEGDPFAALFAAGLSMEASDIFEGGLLAGRDSGARQVGRDPGDIRQKIVDSAPEVARVATEIGCSAAQLCLAFTLTHDANVSTLFGATRLEQLEANLAAQDIVERVGAAELRTLVAPFWADKGVVDPEGP